MLWFTLLVVLAVALPVTAQNSKCYQCISYELKYKWHLTMLPPLKNAVYGDCSNTVNFKQIDCSSPCVQYIVEDPDVINNQSVHSLYFIRGCLTDVIRAQLTLSQDNTFCEYDKNLKQFSSLGEPVDTKYMMKVCSKSLDGNPCNGNLDFPSDTSVCSDSQKNNTVGNSLLNCYECDKKNGECTSGSCTKKYCIKRTFHVDGEYFTQKGCSDVNPGGINEVCSSVALTSQPFNTHTDICYCKDKQYCNSAIKTAPFTIFVLLIAANIFN